MFNFIVVPFLSVSFFLFYLISCSFQLNSSVYAGFIFYDELSIFIVFITCFVIFISFIFCIRLISSELSFVLFTMLVICCLVFTTNNMFMFYLFYEASLIPILYIIMKWGSYPERSVRSIILLLYTSIFTFPFVYILFSFYNSNNSLVFSLFYGVNGLRSSLIFSILIFFTFAVKLPIYGLHFWLPIAHVEAPTFGSIILAGILLKLGGVGLIRFSSLLNLGELKSSVLAYFFVFLVYVTLVCCFQSDFKRLVAYSSVSHIITIPIILLSSTYVGFKGVISVMFLHGIRSPLMFMLVGVMYLFISTRQHLLMRGVLCFSPILSFLIVLAFFFTLSAPPFPSFVAEVLFSLSRVRLWAPRLVFLLLFLFLSIVYNLLWLTSSVFLNQDSSVNYSFLFSYSYFVPIFLSIFVMPVLFAIFFFNVL